MADNTQPKSPPAPPLFVGAAVTLVVAVVVAALGFAGNTALRVEAHDARLKALEATVAVTSSTSATQRDVKRLEDAVDRLDKKIDRLIGGER